MLVYEIVLTVLDEGDGRFVYSVIEGNEDDGAVLADGEYDNAEDATNAGRTALKEILELGNN